MPFKSDECAWAGVSMKVLSRTITGLRGFEFDIDIDIEHLFAAGNKPIDIQEGNEKPSGSIKLLKYEVDLMNDAAQAAGYPHIAKVPKEAILITCAFKKELTSKMRTITAVAVKFSKLNFGMEQNAKMSDVQMPFLCMDIVLA